MPDKARRPFSGTGLLTALTLSGLSACATAPVEQIKYFSQAFSTVNTLGQPLLDDLAIAERIQGQQIAVRRAKGQSHAGAAACPSADYPWLAAPTGSLGVIRGFCLADASYFAAVGEPPATATMRGALAVIERYAELLSTLAEGRNVDTAVGQLNALSADVAGLLGFSGAVAPALGALKPILDSAARQANAAEAKRLILEGAPKVSALIGALRDAAPALFKTLIEAPAAHLTSPAASDPAVAAADVKHIEAYRSTVANYVLLLAKLQAAWDLTVTAAQAPAGQGGLAALVQSSAELKSDAEAARKTFALLRAGAGR